MAKDYRRKANSSHKILPQGIQWTLLAFISGYCIANFFNFIQLRQWVSNLIFSEPPPAKNKSTTAYHDIPKPKLEFYTLLTKDSVSSLADSRIDTISSGKHFSNQGNGAGTVALKQQLPVSPVNTVNKGSSHLEVEKYIIQIASFKKQQEAERLKAALTLHGFDVSIIPAASRQGGWLRVIIGPYSSKDQAEKMQTIIAQREGLKSIVRHSDS